jgi:hypothetical protein
MIFARPRASPLRQLFSWVYQGVKDPQLHICQLQSTRGKNDKENNNNKLSKNCIFYTGIHILVSLTNYSFVLSKKLWFMVLDYEKTNIKHGPGLRLVVRLIATVKGSMAAKETHNPGLSYWVRSSLRLSFGRIGKR